MQLHTPVRQLARVGDTLEKRLAVLGIKTVEDLLHHYPFRYEDFSQLLPIAQVPDEEPITIKAKVELIANKRSARKRTMLTEAIVADDTDRLKIVWFGQPYLAKTLSVGDTVYLSGKISNDRFGRQMTSPSYEKQPEGETAHTARIVPIYPLTKGVTQKQLRGIMKQALAAAEKVEDWLPEEVRELADVMPLKEAMHAIHFPVSQEERTYAENRIKFDELFVLQLRAEMLRRAMRASVALQIPNDTNLLEAFTSGLPFTLTDDQQSAISDILGDIAHDAPMNRLLEGDVGSGKTVVAAAVMHMAVSAGYQCAMMAPTEILAKQHFASLQGTLKETHTIALLTSSSCEITGHTFEKTSKAGKRKELLLKLKNKEIDILVGTHAIIRDDVAFGSLALVVVDEQHRFGVNQRKQIKEQSGDAGTVPHFLSMTATPIPRSFALTLYGDLDISLIKQMPAGRKPIKSRFVEPHNRQKAYAFIRQQVEKGRQVFVICPLIEESGTNVEKKSVTKEFKRLSEEIYPDLSIAMLHGKMRPKEKDAVMADFAEGKTQILVSTSVVEVGVNIPNATVMMIEGADRFGLAQLHQFRGRVGRAQYQSYCLIFSDSDSQTVKERLTKFESTLDGFELAEHDLHTRGPGEVYGRMQSGMQQFRLAKMRDIDLIKKARAIAQDIDIAAYPIFTEKVANWEAGVHLE